MFVWLKSTRHLRTLTPRQLRDYYEKHLHAFLTDRMRWPSGRSSPTEFEQRHHEGFWGGRDRTRKILAQFKEIRQMLRDGYDRKPPKAKGATGACAIEPQEPIRDRRSKVDRDAGRR